MNFFDYLFYGHYITFEKVKKNDFSEAKALVVMASSNLCLIMSVLFICGIFFKVFTSIGVGIFFFVLILLYYYYYFINNNNYVRIVNEFSKTRRDRVVFDVAFTILWVTINYFLIILYIIFKY